MSNHLIKEWSGSLDHTLSLGGRKRITGWPVAMPVSAHIVLHGYSFYPYPRTYPFFLFKTDMNGYGYNGRIPVIPIEKSLHHTHLKVFWKQLKQITIALYHCISTVQGIKIWNKIWSKQLFKVHIKINYCEWNDVSLVKYQSWICHYSLAQELLV